MNSDYLNSLRQHTIGDFVEGIPMIRGRRPLMVASLLFAATSGCSMVEHPSVAMRRMTRMFTPNPNDFDTELEDHKDDWSSVGEEGRADQTRERDPDPWFKKYLMSEKANSVERNLGID